VINLDECELVLFISGIACGISKCYDNDELALMASVFSQLGDTLATIAAKRDLCSSKDSDTVRDVV